VILADSNILIYAINEDSDKNKKAQTFLQKNAGRIVVAHQNILETIRILIHKSSVHPVPVEEAIDLVNRILAAVEIISPTEETFYIFRELIEQSKTSSSRIFDVYLAATCLSNGITEIATDNVKDFKIFPQIKVINLFN